MTNKQVVNINNTTITADISKLIKCESVLFNATEIAKQYGKDIRDYTSGKQFNDYLNAVVAMRKIPATELIITKRGGANQGTWLHNYIAVDFARWCSAEFAVALDIWIIKTLNEEKQRKHDRYIARLEYPEMTNAIKEYWEEKGEYDAKKFYLFTNEADLINKTVLGVTAKQYCEEHGIDRACLRDNLPVKQIEIIMKLQQLNTNMIQIGLNFEDRKQKIKQQYHRMIQKLLK